MSEDDVDWREHVVRADQAAEQYHAVNEELRAEVERLRAEVARLRAERDCPND